MFSGIVKYIRFSLIVAVNDDNNENDYNDNLNDWNTVVTNINVLQITLYHNHEFCSSSIFLLTARLFNGS